MTKSLDEKIFDGTVETSEQKKKHIEHMLTDFYAHISNKCVILSLSFLPLLDTCALPGSALLVHGVCFLSFPKNISCTCFRLK